MIAENEDLSENDPELIENEKLLEKDPEVQFYREENEAYLALINDTKNKLKDTFSLSESGVRAEIGSLELFKSIPRFSGCHEVSDPSGNVPMEFVLVESHRVTSDTINIGYHFLLGILHLRQSHPKTFLYQETFRDRLVDYLVKGDIDFPEHRKFSKTFHLVSEDSEKIRNLWMQKPLDDLAAYPGLEIEVQGTILLFRTSKEDICDENVAEFIQAAQLIQKIFARG